ncbi:MAG: Crp/Fnr family transcriptional regulator [Lachnospiraceae bacterium]
MGKIEETLQSAIYTWDELKPETQKQLVQSGHSSHFEEGQTLHAGNSDCTGFVAVLSGRLRAYMITDEGKEITLFRLVEGDVCILSASCMMKNITFDVWVGAETEAEAVIIPSAAYEAANEKDIRMLNFTNEIMQSRMSEVMWVLEKVLFMSFDKRLAEFLYDQSVLEQSLVLTITHEKIAGHLGSAREVVSRMLKYLASEGLIRVKRGQIEILDQKKLYDYIQ